MSLEESLQLLTNEIKQLILLLKTNNELLRENISKPPSPSVKRNKALTEAEAAKYIGMSRSFLAQDRMNGVRKNRTKGPSSIKVGRKILYDIDELDDWLKKHMR